MSKKWLIRKLKQKKRVAKQREAKIEREEMLYNECSYGGRCFKSDCDGLC